MRNLLMYVDTSVIGGCQDAEFIERGYGTIEIRSPTEVLEYE